MRRAISHGVAAVVSMVVRWCGILTLTAAMLPPLAAARAARLHPLVMRVHFLANSVSVRSGYYESEDVYLAEVLLAKRRDPAVLARLVDDYAPYLGPMRPEILRAAHHTKLRLLRDSSCDIAFGDMPLRTEPGDMLAILPIQLEYRPQLPEVVRPEQILPCYRIVRH
jgi:hypothetical protein